MDSVEIARKGTTLSGEVTVSSLLRLRETLHDSAGEASFSLEGFVNNDGKPSLRLHLRGDLVLACQRCPGPFSFSVSADRCFVLTRPGEDEDLVDLADEGEDVEHILADSKLDVLELVEDELVLGIPIAPIHGAHACALPLPGGCNDGNDSPFGALAALKRNQV